MSRKAAIVILALVMIINCTVAHAESTSDASIYNWTGIHVGVNAGYGFNEKIPPDEPENPTFAGSPSGVAGSVQVGGNPHLRAHGFLGGGQLGYDFQFAKSWLVGLEADLQYSDIHDESVGLQQRLKWLGTVRARLGILPVDRLLLYATAGFAYGRLHSSVISDFATRGQSGSSDSLRAGCAIGGGLEWRLWHNVSLKTEYLYYSLGTQTVSTSPSSGFTGTGVFGSVLASAAAYFKTRGSVIRTGLNYRF